MRSVFLFMGLLSVGCISIWIGISCLLGHRRFDYIFPHYYSGGINYASIPLGIMGIIWAFAFGLDLPENIGLVLTYISLGFGFVGLLFNFIQPAFLTPKWYRWLTENHGDIIPLLRKEAFEEEKKHRNSWTNRVKTQAGLERWVMEVQRKHGLLAEPLDIVRFRIKSGHKHSSWHPQVGDLAMWDRQSFADGSHSGIKATVIDTSEKRVKIEFMEEGQLQTRVIHPKYLIPIEAVEPARNLIPATRHPPTR